MAGEGSRDHEGFSSASREAAARMLFLAIHEKAPSGDAKTNQNLAWCRDFVDVIINGCVVQAVKRSDPVQGRKRG